MALRKQSTVNEVKLNYFPSYLKSVLTTNSGVYIPSAIVRRMNCKFPKVILNRNQSLHEVWIENGLQHRFRTRLYRCLPVCFTLFG